jgi:predicted dienelactone hydrolase
MSPLSWTIAAAVAFENPRLDMGAGPFPVIVFSHGAQNNAIDYAYTLEALASYGYIVAAPDHVNNTQDDARIDAANAMGATLACFDGLPPPCAHTDVPSDMVDRYNDVQAILDNLPDWFGPGVDMNRVGMLGHSRGTVTALAVAGGSIVWKQNNGMPLSADPRIKGLMGLAIGTQLITFGANISNITVPVWLVAGDLDKNSPLAISASAIAALPNTNMDKLLITLHNGVHRHYDSGYCAQMQSSGSIAQANAAAKLDLQTLSNILVSPNKNIGGGATDICALSYFETPVDIEAFTNTVPSGPPKFTFPEPNDSPVPTHGLSTDMVKDQVVIPLATCFFGQVLNRAAGDDGPSSPPDAFKNQPPPPDPTQEDLDAAALPGDGPD